MVLKLNTVTKKVESFYEDDEMDLTDDQKFKLQLDMTSMIVVAMVQSAESQYSNKSIQKLYLDMLSAYAKRLVDPENECDNLDISAKIQQIRDQYQVDEP